MSIPVATTVAEIRAAVAMVRAQGHRVGFVPTMGALHDGHAALVRVAAEQCGFVVASVFVNPTQFGPNEDFARYPRTLAADQAVVAAAGGHLVFAPPVTEMYQPGSLTHVDVARLGDTLCGPRRPGHFRGVCTVVMKLFNIVRPDLAVFGAKDAQQARIIRRMVRDLDVPVELVIADTVREADGLAMSSRNRYLSSAERAAAPGIYRALLALRQRASHEKDVATLQVGLRADLAAIPGARVDYADIVDDEDLQPVARLDRPALAAVAVYVGTTRLIDNITVG